MTQSNLPQVDPQTAGPAQAAAPRHTDAAAETEPLLHLYKMSTTAGVGSQDYVAVNVTAVVAVVFGLASVLCALGYLLLIIPIVGIVLSVIALRQIRNSNGTQTGRGIAWVGLILAGGITAVIGGYRVVNALQLRSDENAIATLCSQFGQYISNGDYDRAYQLFDTEFQGRVPMDEFRSQFKEMQSGDQAPALEGAAWNGIAEFQTDSEGVVRCSTMIKMHYRGTTSDEDDPRLEAHFRRDDNGWRIDSIGGFFATAPSPRG
jgi:uncharacterized protein DUF4190